MAAIIEVIPSGDALGAEVRGIDLSDPLDDKTFLDLEAAFNEHSVICIRDQELDPATFVAYASRYGEPQNLYLNKLFLFLRILVLLNPHCQLFLYFLCFHL